MKKNVFIIVVIIFVISVFILILYRGNRDAEPKGLVAFVIDDWGYNKKNIDLIFQIDRPLTISILPNLRYSTEIAEAVRRNGRHDIILHLPLESRDDMVAEINTIRTNMEEGEILSILRDDIESVPGLIGISNHQGSKATEDKRMMRVVFRELKKRRLFFLDSLTTPDSVCPDAAHNIGLGFVQRDVFLDLTDQTDLEHFESYIRKQIRELVDIALAKGSAVGIGHNRLTTLNVIKDSILELERQGIKIVPLKELVK